MATNFVDKLNEDAINTIDAFANNVCKTMLQLGGSRTRVRCSSSNVIDILLADGKDGRRKYHREPLGPVRGFKDNG